MKRIPGEIKILGNKGDKVESITINKSRRYFINRERRRKGTHGESKLSSAKRRSTARPASTEDVLCFHEAKPVFNYLGYSQKEVAEVLEVNASTLSRWKKHQKDETLGKLQSKVVWHIDEIIAKGVKLFGSEESFKIWLNTPNYALGDVKPIELLKDPYDIEIVDNAIEAMSWGNFI